MPIWRSDIRVLLRERLVAGDSDAAARQFLVDRYGDFVLLKPPLETATLLLWFGPALVLRGRRRRRGAVSAPPAAGAAAAAADRGRARRGVAQILKEPEA